MVLLLNVRICTDILLLMCFLDRPEQLPAKCGHGPNPEDYRSAAKATHWVNELNRISYTYSKKASRFLVTLFSISVAEQTRSWIQRNCKRIKTKLNHKLLNSYFLLGSGCFQSYFYVCMLVILHQNICSQIKKAMMSRYNYRPLEDGLNKPVPCLLVEKIDQFSDNVCLLHILVLTWFSFFYFFSQREVFAHSAAGGDDAKALVPSSES